MPSSKYHIKNHFNRANATYDAVSTIQKECAHRLVAYLKQQAPNLLPQNILDVGSGTGHVIEALKGHFPAPKITANDIAPAMLDQIESKFPHSDRLSFVLGDMDLLSFHHHDLVTSNFALQWSSHFHETLTKLYKGSDIFAFSCLLDGTFAAWQDLLNEPLALHYPKHSDVEDFLHALNPKTLFTKPYSFEVTFQSARDVIRYVKQLGANGGGAKLPSHKIKKLLTLQSQPITITYNVLFCIMRRI